MKAPRFFWRLIHFGPRIAYALGLGPLLGRFVLLLTTYGRKSGRPRVTPLVFEQQGETILVALRNEGIRVPTLCHMEGLPPSGACRLCVVEVEGAPTAGARAGAADRKPVEVLCRGGVVHQPGGCPGGGLPVPAL